MNILHLPRLLTRSFECEPILFTRRDSLTAALVAASLPRALHRTHNEMTSITDSDPYRKSLRESWKFLYFFSVFPRHPYKKLPYNKDNEKAAGKIVRNKRNYGHDKGQRDDKYGWDIMPLHTDLINPNLKTS